MAVEVVPIEHSSNEQHRSAEPNMMSKSADRQNTSPGETIWKKFNLSYKISKSRYSFFLTLNNINLFYIYYQ